MRILRCRKGNKRDMYDVVNGIVIAMIYFFRLDIFFSLKNIRKFCCQLPGLFLYIFEFREPVLIFFPLWLRHISKWFSFACLLKSISLESYFYVSHEAIFKRWNRNSNNWGLTSSSCLPMSPLGKSQASSSFTARSRRVTWSPFPKRDMIEQLSLRTNGLTSQEWLPLMFFFSFLRSLIFGPAEHFASQIFDVLQASAQIWRWRSGAEKY